MHKLLLGGLGGLCALGVAVTPSLAYGVPSPVPVDGNHFRSSRLSVVSQGCVDSRAHPVTAPRFAVRRGPGSPPIGHYSSGWAPASDTYGVGSVAHVSSPSTLKTLRIHLDAPSGSARGHVVVSYHAPNDDGVWRGNADLGADAVKGWHVVNAAGAALTWAHFTNGYQDNEAAAATLPAFAKSRGGEGAGAEVGFLYGCDGNPFFVDGLQVVTAAESRTFDLGGFRARASIGIKAQGDRKIRITYGQKIALAAHLRKKFDGTGLAGKLRLQSRHVAGGSWHTFATKSVGAQGDTGVGVLPARSTAYRNTYAGSATYEPNASSAVTLLVRPYVTASFVHGTVTKGHTFTLRGRILPARHAAIKLQHYVDGQWRTVRKGTSGKDGRYAMSAVTRKVGRSYWRIFVAAGGGNISGKSPWTKLTTVAPPPPPNDPTPTPTPPPPYDPPPPPPNDPPPPPPPSH